MVATEAPLLELAVAGRDQPLAFRPERLVIAGFTGRDRTETDRHIAELEALGIAPPEQTPAFYEVPPGLLTTSERVEVDGTETSGEVEPVLLCTPEGRFVTVGSDHTARDLEREDIRLSKVACPKVIATEVVSAEEAAEHWDDTVLESWTGAARERYQAGSTKSLMTISSLLELLESRMQISPTGLVMFLGTVPLLTPRFVFSDAYSLRMGFPHGRDIELAYRVSVNGKQADRGE